MNNITLPEMPTPIRQVSTVYSETDLREYARAAVLADRTQRPKTHMYQVALMADGSHNFLCSTAAQHNIVIRWNSERVWLENA